MKNTLIILLLLISISVFGQTNARTHIEGNNYAQGVAIQSDQGLTIARGELNGYSTIYKFGRNAAVGNTEEVILDGGGEYLFTKVADYLEVFSSNDNDSLNGSNAWDIYVFGLDSSGYEQTEFFQLKGTTIVTGVKKFYRVYRAFVYHAGTTTTTNGNNIGTITIRKATGDTIMAQIRPGNGQTLMCIYTIPKGKTGYLTGYSLSSGQGKSVLFKSKFRNCAYKNCAFTVKDIREVYQNNFLGTLVTPLRIPELTDMIITGQNTIAGDVTAAASFGMILINE